MYNRLPAQFDDDIVASGSAAVCCVCFHNRSKIMYSPCNHFCICLYCNTAKTLVDEREVLQDRNFIPTCPICRNTFSSIVEINYGQNVTQNGVQVTHPRLPPRETFDDILVSGTSDICSKCFINRPKFMFLPCNHVSLCYYCKAIYDIQNEEQLQTDLNFTSLCVRCLNDNTGIVEIYYS